MFTQSLRLSALFLLLALGACSRMQVVPEEPPPSVGPEIIPPISEQPAPPPSSGTTRPYPGLPTTGGTTHVVQAGETLYRIGKQYGYDYRQIAAWNNIPPPYTLSVGQRLVVSPPGSGPVVTQPETPSYGGGEQYYTVQRGDTLYSIGRRYGRNFADLAAWNNIPPPYNLNVGQRLIVSSPGGAISMPAPVSSGPTIVEFIPPPMPTTPTPVLRGESEYVVQAGDTLYAISRRYGHNYRDIAAWNNISPPYSLSVGQRLIVSPPGSTASMVASMPSLRGSVLPLRSGEQMYTVQRGDTLYHIARLHGRSYQELAAWNNLRRPYKLLVGQKLRLASPQGSMTASSSGFRSLTAPPMTMPPSFKSAAAPSSPTKTYHTVQHGESLASIAAKYGQSTHELALWNGIAPPYILKPGQSLLVVE